MRRHDDSGVAAVIGAIVVLAVIGIALVYVNAYYVPRQGAALELDAAEHAEGAFIELATMLAAAPDGPLSQEVPLSIPRATPPLLSGVVLTPLRVGGTVALEPASSKLTLSVVVPAPASGVPAGDPARESASAGNMRVYLVGSKTAGQSLGALRATTGGAYASNSSVILEGGAVSLDTRAASATVSAPSLDVEADKLSWRVPLLAGGAAEVTGATVGQVTLTPGPEAQLGGGSKVSEVRIKVETTRLAAWQAALDDVVGGRGTITATTTAPDEGTLTATLSDVKLELFLVRYQVALADRVG